MKSEYIIPAVIAFGVVIGYNAFLIKRDTELFKAYDNQVKYDHPSLKEAFCSSQAKWNPNCNVK